MKSIEAGAGAVPAQKRWEEGRKADERDIEANKKCAISMTNIIKII